MISFYIHIPFCKTKCNYCNFFVVPFDKIKNSEEYIQNYQEMLKSWIYYYAESFADIPVKTIYFGWWTPLLLGKDKIFELIDLIQEKFDLSYLEELSFELNPDPFREVLDFVESANKKYKNFFRIRYSFGIQTFDDNILKSSGRNYVFNNLMIFLRQLRNYKLGNNVFNFDFISFWTIKDWYKIKHNFLENFVESWFADSFSLYTLELFPGSYWYYSNQQFFDKEEEIYYEFEYIKNLLFSSWYKRYEISNFEKAWRRSLHNMVYRTMWNYIWLGSKASSFLNYELGSRIFDVNNGNAWGIRFENKTNIKNDNNFINPRTIEELTSQDFLVEELFLGLRTDQGISSFERYQDVLVDNWQSILEDFVNQWFVERKDEKIILTDSWMDLYNHLITSLIKDF